MEVESHARQTPIPMRKLPGRRLRELLNLLQNALFAKVLAREPTPGALIAFKEMQFLSSDGTCCRDYRIRVTGLLPVLHGDGASFDWRPGSLSAVTIQFRIGREPVQGCFAH